MDEGRYIASHVEGKDRVFYHPDILIIRNVTYRDSSFAGPRFEHRHT